MSEVKYLSCSGNPGEYVALAAIPVDEGAFASVLLVSPTIRMGAETGLAVVELRQGSVVVHHWEWELPAGSVFHLPGKWVLNQGFGLYFASYATGASLEAFAMVNSDDIGTGGSGGVLPIVVPHGAWYIEERVNWLLGCKATWSMDENGMPDVVTYSGKVAVPYCVRRGARQNTTGATLSAVAPLVPLSFGDSPAGEAIITLLSEGPFSTQALAQAKITADYNAIPEKYRLSLSGESEIRSTWTNPDNSINFYPELITTQYGPGAGATPGSPNIVSEVWDIPDISGAISAFPDASITSYNFAYRIYEEIYP